MNDQHHSSGVSAQSTAIVMAALITMVGAVTAALIQTGWFGKPETVSIAPATDTPRVAGFAPDTSEFFPTPIDKSAILAPYPSAKLIGTITAAPVSQATFTGKIEPAPAASVPPQTFANAHLSPNTQLRPIAAPTASLTSVESVPHRLPQQNSVYYPPTAEIQTSYHQPAPTVQPPIAQVPIAQTPSAQISWAQTTDTSPNPDVKTLNSPWTYLAQESGDNSSAAKPVKKSLDWSSITRLFQGR